MTTRQLDTTGRHFDAALANEQPARNDSLSALEDTDAAGEDRDASRYRQAVPRDGNSCSCHVQSAVTDGGTPSDGETACGYHGSAVGTDSKPLRADVPDVNEQMVRVGGRRR